MTKELSKFNSIIVRLSIFANIASIILFSYIEGLTFIPKIFALLLFFQYLYFSVAKNWTLLFPREYKLLVLWFVWACFCTILSNYSDTVIDKVMTLVQVYGLSFVMFQFIVRLKLVDTVCFSLVLSLFASTAIAISGYGELATIEGRVYATLSNPNVYGVALIFGIAFSAHLILSGKTWFILKPILIIGLGLFFYMTLETGSRKALFGSLLIVIFFMYSYYQANLKGKIFKTGVLIIVGCSIFAAGSIAIYNSDHFGRIQRIFDAVQSGDKSKAGLSETGRLELYEIGLQKIWESPLLGSGLDSFRGLDYNSGFGTKIGTYSHSNYIEIGVTTGIVGLLLYYSAMFSVLARVIFTRRRGDNYILASTYALVMPLMAMQLLFDFALVSYYEKIFWLFNTFLISFSYMYSRENVIQRYRKVNIVRHKE